ncbi:peptidoglycan binding protein CsiV [Pseudoalteromonas sp. MMG006]|uniref:peptidoglycan binding protein CsiV n=1 Tax=Pseudoalteromonas sp. MMG006 TaxID=2822683 RepID=UPI001B381B9B|nr:peptidoglycan binding protein CsiV [Pseudoalteromonas sp. MMG006]MBQ4799322.1 peptidoglycan binding protein CsiV [Pseudoalteromonas sp. MMG006]
MLLKKSLIVLCCLFSSTAFAERWFEVEVLVFKQRPAPYLQEDFTLKHDAIEDKNSLDLMTPLYTEQAMQACIDGDVRFQKHSFTDSLVNSNPQSGVCDDSTDYMQSYDELPVTPQVAAQDHMQQTYLLAPEQLKFKTQLRQLDRKGLTPILHTGWRFEGASKSRAPSMHLIAGKHIKSDINAIPSYSNPDFVSLLNTQPALFDDPDNANVQWELDGLFKIHLRHYLYITANFDISHKLENGEIESARFSQFRRVISGEVHYFDHPRMGMIVQIRKFKH